MSEQREPYKRSAKPSPDNLPVYYTCRDCLHFERCKSLLGRIETDEVCDWTPSRFAIDRSKLVLLQNCTAGYLGNSPVFWREDGSGYTQWIDEAKRWPEAEADAQIRSTSGTHDWRKWPLAVVEKLAKRTIDIQEAISVLNKLEVARESEAAQ
jgi:hypothetical protein